MGDFSEYSIVLSNPELPSFLRDVQTKLKKRIIGQSLPIKKTMEQIVSFYAMLNDPKRPIAVLMFAGPSGIGKTYFAEELAYALIGEPKGGLSPLVKIDCASLSLNHTVASLTGSPPGYIGYKDKVNLEMVGDYDREKRAKEEMVNDEIVEFEEMIFSSDEISSKNRLKIKNHLSMTRQKINEHFSPFRSVVVFDEIEKADPNIQSQLLRILDEGEIDLLSGRKINFKGSIIILTTNVGTKQVLAEHIRKKGIGFSVPNKKKLEKDSDLNDRIRRQVLREILDDKKGHFKPELLSRIGKQGIIVFNVLGYEDYRRILDLRLGEIQKVMAKSSNKGPGKLKVSYVEGFKDFLIKEGISDEFGARALNNIIDKYVRVPIAENILSGDLAVGDEILLDIEFEKASENKEAGRTKIRRKRRQKGRKAIPFKTREDGVRDLDIEKLLYMVFDKIFDEYLPDQEEGATS